MTGRRTDMIEITHNAWVDPAAITVIRFRPAPLLPKNLPPCPDGMALEVWVGTEPLTDTWFDGSNTKAWDAARDRMRELVQRVDAAKAGPS